MLTGNVGPNAYQTLKAASLPVFTGVEGTVREAIEKNFAGELEPSADPSVGSHYGLR